MRFNRPTFAFASSILTLATAVGGCNNGSGSSSTPVISLPNGTSLAAVSGTNAMSFSVSAGPDCSNSKTIYTNKPCVTVTVCNADGTGCSTISDILLDTGSSGLRVFKSVLTAKGISLTPTTVSGSNTLNECIEYGDGSKQWGPVATAQVGLASESKVTVPIQEIDSTAPGMSSNCSGAVVAPADGGFNGILGVGLFDKDCGYGCTVHTSNGMYFSCGASTCTGTTTTLSQQVRNPVAALPKDNNGVILQLPNIALGGVVSSSGYLIFGIGTQSNNGTTGVTAYAADPNYGQFTTTYNNVTYSSFLDSGSNALSFPGTNISDCGGSQSGWFCPSSVLTLSAVNTAYSVSGTGNKGTISFQIENYNTFLSTLNYAIKEIGASSGSGNISNLFDWGLPFYFGRNVFVQIESSSSTLGTGPLWAY